MRVRVNKILTRESVPKKRLPHSPVLDPVTRASRSAVDAISGGNRNKMLEALRNVNIAKKGVR